MTVGSTPLSIMRFSIMSRRIITLRTILTLSILILSITTISILILSITAISILKVSIEVTHQSFLRCSAHLQQLKRHETMRNCEQWQKSRITLIRMTFSITEQPYSEYQNYDCLNTMCFGRAVMLLDEISRRKNCCQFVPLCCNTFFNHVLENFIL
jgi:hypothetical protein